MALNIVIKYKCSIDRRIYVDVINDGLSNNSALNLIVFHLLNVFSSSVFRRCVCVCFVIS